jgi:DNA-binding beta-propeller fold protein YncE
MSCRFSRPTGRHRFRLSGAGSWRGFTFVLLVALALSAVGAATSSAAPKDAVGVFGSGGSGDGQFATPGAMAVNEATKDVYVVDINNNRVERFDADGNYLSQFGSSGSDAGQFAFFGNTAGVAVAPDGTVYVADTGNNRIQLFAADGTFISQFGTAGSGDGELLSPAGVAVDSTTGDVLVADRDNNRIQRFTAAGVYVSQFGSPGADLGQFLGPSGVAVDSAGQIYVLEQFNRVQKFDAAGQSPELIGASTLTNAPHQFGVDLGTNKLFVAQFDSTFSHVELLEFAADGTLVETHSTPVNQSPASGTAIDPTTGRTYVGDYNGNRVFILDVADAPTATIEPVTDIGTRGATFHGAVATGGALTSYRFEYSTDGTDWAPYPQDYADVGADSGSIPVSETVAGLLKPHTLYQVRLVAKHTYSDRSDTSSEVTFTTDSAPPTVSPVATADADATAATLIGRINPNSEPTTYRFEYGTSTAYGSSVPANDGNAGATGNPVTVTEILTGLLPSTVYHYRVVATNPSGTTTGGDHVFTTRPVASSGACPNAELRKGVAALLPDCRAYEQVSPADKNGNDIDSKYVPTDAGGAISDDGDATAFAAFGSFANTRWGGTGTLSYLARRGADGWHTISLFPPPLVDEVTAFGYIAPHFTPSLDKSILETQRPLTDDPLHEGYENARNWYLQDTASGALQQVISSSNALITMDAASRDLSHVAITSSDVLTSDSDLPVDGFKVYEAVGGQLRLVSRRPDGQPFQTPSVLGSLEPEAPVGAMSDDGRHIFFTNGELAEKKIYRRTDGSTTTLVSPSRRTPPDPLGESAKVFNVATSDGSKVFFTSSERLTNDSRRGSDSATGDLYRYDADNDELIDVSAGVVGSGGADVQGVVGIDADGQRVYFVALGQLVPGQGVAGLPNLYLWEDDGSAQGSARFIATLDSAVGESNSEGFLDPFDSENWAWNHNRTAEVTDNGDRLVFQSRANITGYPSDGKSQVYLYDASADAGSGKLICLSCSTDGSPPIGHSRAGLVQAVRFAGSRRRAMSSDGARVVFHTANPLLPRDSNGKFDAYLWDDGDLSLLSSGTHYANSYSYGLSANGDDAFFRTRESLVPADGDTLIDVYTAHVRGGFASQQAAAQPDCQGEVCQGLPNPARGFTDVPSAGAHSLGNVRPLRACRRFTTKAKRLALRARSMRRRASRAPGTRHATRLRRRAAVLTGQARKQRAKARRCRAYNRRTAR